MYVPTSTTVLSENPAVFVPILTINGWILMQRKVTGGSVTFNQMWVDYRDGFGSPTGNDNYWLGLDKVYRFVQLDNVRLRIEVILGSMHAPFPKIYLRVKSANFGWNFDTSRI